MTEIFINTHNELVIGAIHIGEVLNEEMIPIKMVVKPIRIASKKEYLEFVRKHDLMDRVKRSINNPDIKFYLVEILD